MKFVINIINCLTKIVPGNIRVVKTDQSVMQGV